MTEVYAHVRPTDAAVDPGVYRVVGTGDGVTLLRVGDAEGRRVSTGEVVSVADLSGFEAADNPDGNRSLGDRLTSVATTAYWSLRAFLTSVLAHPVPSLAAIALMIVGNAAEGTFPVPDAVGGVLVIVGALGLAYVGSGRLDG